MSDLIQPSGNRNFSLKHLLDAITLVAVWFALLQVSRNLAIITTALFAPPIACFGVSHFTGYGKLNARSTWRKWGLFTGLVQFGSFPWIKTLPESIVVGIANVDRKRDFTTPAQNEQDKKDFPTAGGSAKYIEMLETEIQPLVNKRYRNNGVETIFGQSFGGLLVTEILFTKPNLFDNYIIVSPSLWWNERSLLKSQPKNIPNGTSIFVGVGKEGKIMESLANELHQKTKAMKTEDIRLFFQYFPELDHGDTLHLAVYRAFEEIFSTSRL